MMGFRGSHGFARTRSWNVRIISEPVLASFYRHQTFMKEPVVRKYDTKENLFLKF